MRVQQFYLYMAMKILNLMNIHGESPLKSCGYVMYHNVGKCLLCCLVVMVEQKLIYELVKELNQNRSHRLDITHMN